MYYNSYKKLIYKVISVVIFIINMNDILGNIVNNNVVVELENNQMRCYSKKI